MWDFKRKQTAKGRTKPGQEKTEGTETVHLLGKLL